MKTILLIPLYLAFIFACTAQPQWMPNLDNEDLLYQHPSVQKSDKTIFETIATLAPLKMLNDMLQEEGFEKTKELLNSPGNYTFFAPNNDAIALAHLNSSHAGIVSTILEYHVVNVTIKSSDFGVLTLPNTMLTNDSFVHLGGDSQKLQVLKIFGKLFVPFGIPGEMTFTASVGMTDVGCSNGVIHVINKVVMPPADVKYTLFRAGLTTFMAALHKTGLMKELEQKNKISVFAPSNDAFFCVDATKLSEDQIIAILKYHVVEDTVYSPDLYNGQLLNTWLGEEIKISKLLYRFGVNQAEIEVANVLMSNGVIHIIDQLLIPPDMEALVRKQ